MATIRCPLCGTELTQDPVCPVCGWDTSADPELYPTFFSAAGTSSRGVRGEEARARAAEAEREALYIRFGRTVFAGQTTEDLRSCAEAEDAAEGVRRLAALLGIALTPSEPQEASVPEPGSPAGPVSAPVSSPGSGDRGNSYVLRPSALLPSAAFKDQIQAVRFQDSLRGLALNHWDVSEARDGSVLACLQEEYGLLTLLICGEKGVYAPADCSDLFLDFKMLRNVDFGGCFHTEGCADMHAMFYGCLCLTAVDMSGLDASGVKDARAMFSNCASLVRAALPRGLTAVYAHMFAYCPRLKELRIPEGIVGIGDYAFSGCSALPGLSLPDTVIGVGRYAFRDCTALNGITLSRKLRHMDSGAFRGCTGLTEIVIPGTVSRIGALAFQGCSRLQTVYFTGTPDRWQSIVEKPNATLERTMVQFSI